MWNLSTPIYFKQLSIGGRLISLGRLFNDVNRTVPLGDSFTRHGFPRKDRHLNADCSADDGTAGLANSCALFTLEVECTLVVVAQETPLAEQRNHRLVKACLSDIKKDSPKPTVSVTHCAMNMTLATYIEYVHRFCVTNVAETE